jgi:hypothetical protein
MIDRLVAALIAISLTACAVAPERHTTNLIAAIQSVASNAPPSIVSADAGVASESTGGGPDAETPPPGPAGPARVIAAVLLVAILIVVIVAGAQSAGRSIARSCCNER